MLPLFITLVNINSISIPNAFWQVIPVIIILLLIIYIIQPTQVHIKKDTIQISGFYGRNIKFHEIKNIQLSHSIPPILLRTNGLSIGPVKKGGFQLKDIGKCSLFLNGDYAPYLFLETMSNEIIIINDKDEEHIRHIYSIINKNL